MPPVTDLNIQEIQHMKLTMMHRIIHTEDMFAAIYLAKFINLLDTDIYNLNKLLDPDKTHTLNCDFPVSRLDGLLVAERRKIFNDTYNLSVKEVTAIETSYQKFVAAFNDKSSWRNHAKR